MKLRICPTAPRPTATSCSSMVVPVGASCRPTGYGRRMGTSLHEYGAKASGIPVEDSDRVGPTAEDAVRAGLNLLKVFPIATVMRFDPAYLEPCIAAKVDLYCIRIGTVLPIGVGDVAEHVRSMLSAGFDGWTMPPLPPNPEPLLTSEKDLPIKVVNLLRRHEFRTAEEVALVPDEALLELRGMGTTLLARLREVIPPAYATSDHTPTGGGIIAPGAAAHSQLDNAGWIGTGSLLHRLGMLTTSLATVLAREASDNAAARAQAVENIAALQAELSTFADTNLDPHRPGGRETAEPTVWCGNAADDGAEHRGWFVGHFLDAATGARASEDVELKWGQHVRGEHRDDWAPGDRRTTLTLLFSGGPWRVQFPEREYTLTRPGDYLLFGPGIAHTWHADGDTTMLTVRWPSRP